MNTEIYIEGRKADLTADIPAQFTYSIADVKDFSTRDTSFSMTLIFPGTGRNNQLFGSAFEFNAYNDYNPTLPNIGANFNAAKKAKARVLINGIQVFKGVLQLLEITNLNGAIEYQASMSGELGGLMATLGNKLLTGNVDTAGNLSTTDDLDFSSYNQAWTHANIIASWATHDSTGGGSGVYFPLIDYGKCTTNRVDFSYQAMRPALYVHEYIVNILEAANYTWDCPFFETAFFLRLIVPHNEDTVYKMVRLLVDHRSPTLGIIHWLESLTPGFGGTLSRNVDLQISVALSQFTSSTTGTGTTFTYTGPSVFARLTSRIVLSYGGGQGRVKVTCDINVNGVSKAQQVFYLLDEGVASGYPPTIRAIDLSLDVPHIQINPSDVITVSVTASYPGIAPVRAWAIDLRPESRLTVTSATDVPTPAGYGDDLSINNLIPKGILQRDFLLSIAKLFNLYIFEDPNTDRHLIIRPFVDFFDNTDPNDWSGKVDRMKGVSLKPMSEVNARYFNFLYEQDNDYDNEFYFKRYGRGYADRVFDAGLDFVKDKKDLKIIFGSSPLIGVSGNPKAVTRIMKLDGSGGEQRTSSKIRILQAKRIAVAAWNVLEDDLTTVINNTSFYGYAGHVDDPGTPQGADLNFGAPSEMYWVPANPYLAPNVFAAFYSAYMAEITDKDSKLLSCFIRLAPVEIYNIDFQRAIVIDGQVWRLNRIIDYDAVNDNVTKVELLKVINLSY